MKQLALLMLFYASSAFAQCTGSGTTWNCLAGSTSAQVETVLTTAADGFILTISPGTYTAAVTSGGVAWAFSNSRGGTIICSTAPTLGNGAIQDPTPVTTMGFHNKLVGAASTNACILKLSANLGTPGGAIGMSTASGTNSHFYRVSGMTIDCNGFTATAGDAGLILFDAINGTSATMLGPGPNFYGGIRVDHNTFQNCGAATQNFFFGDTSVNTINISGVVDHNYFTGASFETLVEWNGGRPATFSGTGVGTLNNVFFEDNYAPFASMTNQSSEGCSDGQWGDSHIVFRFNHTIDCAYATHAPWPSYISYWNLIEFDSNATGMITACGSINGCRSLHSQGTGQMIVFSNIVKLPGGSTEAGDPFVNQDYRQHAGVSNTAGVNPWVIPTSYTVSGGNTTLNVTAFSGGTTPGFSRFNFQVVRGATNAGNNTPFNPFVATTSLNSGVMASLAGQVTETPTTMVIGRDDNGEMYPCDGTISAAPVGYDGSNSFTTITDGNRSPSSTWFGYPCAMQPGRTMPAVGTAGTYAPNVFVGNTFYNTGNAAHGLIEEPPVANSVVPNAFPPTNCGTATTLTVPCDYSTIHLQANREYFVNFGTAQTSTTSPWDGTFTQHTGYGAGYGTFANMPTTCTQSSENANGGNAGGMYLATDQGPLGADGVTPIGKLYTCGSGGTYIVYFDPASQPYPHPLVANPPVATFTPSPVNIGLVPPNLTSNSVSVTLQNAGGSTLTNTGITLSSNLFTVINNTCGSPATITSSIPGTGFTLGINATCSFQVTVTPAVVGPVSANLIFVENTSLGADFLALNATGTGPPAPTTVMSAGKFATHTMCPVRTNMTQLCFAADCNCWWISMNGAAYTPFGVSSVNGKSGTVNLAIQ